MSLRLAVFISGRGTNLQALLDSPARRFIKLVVSSRKLIRGVGRARRAGVEVLVIAKETNWEGLSQELYSRRIQGIFLLGFMKIIPEIFLEKWQGRMWNLHPSLLPHFKGLDGIGQSFQAGGPVGITIHKVIPEMDAGPRFLQRKISDSRKDFHDKYTSVGAVALQVAHMEQASVRLFLSRLVGRYSRAG